MRVRIGQRAFRPRLLPALLTGAAIAAFVTLGTWQLGRADQKRALQAAFERGAGTSVTLGRGTADGLPRYQHVTALGHYDASRQVLLDDMPSRTGLPGYRVLTPFVREGAPRLLLVDRGWVPLGATRAVLPDVTAPTGERETGGRLDQLPVPGIRVGTAGTPGDTHWPRVLLFPTRQDLEQVLGAPVEPRILLLDAARPDGYEREWHPALGFPPERHLGYAVQWFALALVAGIVFVALSLESAAPGSSDE